MVIFEPLGLRAEVRPDETLLDAARRAGAPVGNSCGATGVCGRCRVRIVSGGEVLGQPTTIELRVAAASGFDADERLACQAVVRGDCKVTTSYW
jgi:ferredoxin, 2Fe-2S